MVWTQEDLLLALIQGSDGEKWASKRLGWKEGRGTTACDWEGVECDTHGRVVSLLLTNNGLAGTIPTLIGKLTSLKTVRLGNNKLYGPLPMELASLPSIVNLDLSTNRITGTLPSFLSPQLRTLFLDSNDFHGAIPQHVITSKNTLIQELSLSQNRISGTIPPTIGQLTTLNKIDLSSNTLYGTIPDEIGDILLLQHLALNNNYLVGSIPQSIALANPINGKMGDLLETIYLQSNMLSGTIPVQLSDLPRLQELLIDENKLTGEVPTDVCSPAVNKHFFQHSQSGNDGNVNYCNAISCPVNTKATDGVAPCTSCNNPHYNPYLGVSRQCNPFVNQRDILKKFYYNTNEDGNWNGEDNWRDEGAFLCDFTGVKCDENNHVVEINLKNRGLKGTIPDEIGFLKYLEKFDVSDNDLSGFLPSDFRWAPLKSIDVSGNSIHGMVPPNLCLKAGVNGNGDGGDYNCDRIACSDGTYSPSGRQDSKNNCVPCRHNPPPAIGLKTCRRVGMGSGAFGAMIFFMTWAVVGAIIYLVKSRKRATADKYEVGNSSTESSDDGSEKEGLRQAQTSSQSTTEASSLPYPEAALPPRRNSMNTNRGFSNTTKSVRSLGSKSGRSSASGSRSIASDSSSSNKQDVWLDVPNIA